MASCWRHARVPLALAGAALPALLVTLALLPAAPARASAPPAVRGAAISLPPGGIGELSAENVDELLGDSELGSNGVPLSALEAPLLARQLSRLSGISALATVNGLGGTAGVEQAMLSAIETIVAEDELVEELVGGSGLAIDFEEQLEATYEASQAAHEPGAPETLEEAVEETLHRSPEEVIDEGLESQTLGELLSTLLDKAAHPETLATALFHAVEPETLEELLGSALGSEPFTRTTVGEVATAIGITAAELAEKLGKTPAQLPEAALALFTPLHDGQQLGVFAAKKGLAYGLVGEAPPAQEEPEEPEGAEGTEAEQNEQPAGSPGGSPVSKAGASPESTNTSSTSSTPSATPASVAPMLTPATSQPATRSGGARIRIVEHKVKGANATLIVEVLASGRLTVSGRGIVPVYRPIARAERVSIRLSATRAAVTLLRKRHRLKLTLRAAFAPAVGAPSVASTTVALR